MEQRALQNYVVYSIIIVAVVSRLVPHMANVAPITALAIFSAVYLPKAQALAIPFLARFISDAIIGFFSWKLLLVVYASHLVGFILGRLIKTRKSTASRWGMIAGSGFVTAMIFFLTTNFAFLYAPQHYPHTFDGIILAYSNGLPFLRGSLIGDVGYTVGLFAVQAFAMFVVKRLSIKHSTSISI